jgi:nicotinamidase-related amidase
MSAAHRKNNSSLLHKQKRMPELSHIDPASAALLGMDYQVDTLTRFMTAAQSVDAIACVPHLIATARDAGMTVIHVVVAFRPGHPEVSPRNPEFRAVKANGMLAAGSARRRDPSGRSGTRAGTDRGQAPRQPLRWH